RLVLGGRIADGAAPHRDRGVALIGGHLVDVGVVNAVGRTEERGAVGAVGVSEEIGVAGDLISHRAEPHAVEVGVRPGVVGHLNLPGINHRTQRRSVDRPRAVGAGDKEGQPGTCVAAELGERTHHRNGAAPAAETRPAAARMATAMAHSAVRRSMYGMRLILLSAQSWESPSFPRPLEFSATLGYGCRSVASGKAASYAGDR